MFAPAKLPRGNGRIRLKVHQRVAELVIDNPSRRNAISPGMMADLDRAISRLDEEDPADFESDTVHE